MRNPESMLRVFEELAARFVKQNEPRFRDHCLVLAADSALAANRPNDAERLRQRLLQYNPHHLLRPFASMSEASQAPDVQEYIADLRRQWPPEFVQKLYLGGPDEPAAAVEPSPAVLPRTERPVKDTTAPAVQAKAVEPIPVAPPPRRPPQPAPVVYKPAAVPPPLPPPRRAREAAPTAALPLPIPRGAGPVNWWLATMVMFLGIAAGLGLLFITVVWPLLD
jgi:hypothetical protein